MSWIEIIADRKIREAQDEGRFEGLPGHGRPLALEIDTRTPPEQRIAARILKDSGFVPDWIELERDLRRRREALETRIAAFAERRAADLAEGAAAADRRRDLFLLRCAEEIVALNGLVERFNLVVPLATRQVAPLRGPERLEELEARFPRATPAAGPAPWRQVLERPAPRPLRLGNRMPRRRP